MADWDMNDPLDYKAAVTALTESNRMEFENTEAKHKWIYDRMLDLWWKYVDDRQLQ